MFDLVADIERYPAFLPWVVAVRVRERSDTLILADVSAGFRALRETFTCRVSLDRPGGIDVDYVSGPLSRLVTRWRFEPAADGHCRVHFLVDFEFRSRLFERLAGVFFHEAFRQMVSAFEKRARALYGSSSRSATSAA
jgi:coenzyme Q-binding protein COQ10